MSVTETATSTPSFWYVSTRVNNKAVHLAVSAFTERSARVQVRKRVGKDATIERINKFLYPHAWVINHGWRPEVEGQS